MQQLQSKPMSSSSRTKKALYGPVAIEFVATNTGIWRDVKPNVDAQECTLCGFCSKYCPADVITVEKKGSERGISFDWDYCKGCGICANVCPKQCIDMIPEEGVNI